jgi:hypothetical protein
VKNLGRHPANTNRKAKLRWSFFVELFDDGRYKYQGLWNSINRKYNGFGVLWEKDKATVGYKGNWADGLKKR